MNSLSDFAPGSFPLVEIGGAPLERGVAYGQKAAALIRRCISHYNAQFASMSVERDHLAKVIAGYVPVISRFDAALVEEMRGIAQGASVPFEDIVLINARTEITKLAARSDSLEALADSLSDEGCTGVVILPDRPDGSLVHGQNWDWKTICVESALVLRVKSEHGRPDILVFTEAGALARCGMNSAGLALTANFLGCDRDFLKIGVPSPLIRRKALEQADFALAMRIIATTPKTGSSNVMLSHASGYAFDLECAPDETFILRPENGMLVHANHWISPVAKAKVIETGLSSYPESVFRQQRVEELLQKGCGGNPVDAAKRALGDLHLSPWSVCRPPSPNPCHGNMSTATVATILMQPELGLLAAAPLPAVGGEFATYQL